MRRNENDPLASSHRTRVLCVDDSPEMAAMLALMVRSQSDLEDAGTLDSCDQLVSEVEQRHADVVVVDLTMPGAPPLGAIRELGRRARFCRVIAFSGYDGPAERDAAIRAGARELVSKHGDPADIIQAIRRVAGR